MTGTTMRGQLRLVRAHIGGALVLDGAQLTNTAGPALNATGATIDQSTLLRGGFTATGTGENGTVCLIGVHIGQELDLTASVLSNTTGPALQSRALRVDGALVAGDPDDERLMMRATGCGKWGVIRLAQAQIGGRLVLTGAKINHTGELEDKGDEGASSNGPALNAQDLNTAGSVLLDRCEISGCGPDAAVWLSGARVDGELSLQGTHVTNPRGPAVSMTRARIDRGLLLDGAVLTGGAGEDGVGRGAVRLIGTSIGGNLVVDSDIIEAACRPKDPQRWAIDDLTYANTPTGPGGAPLHSRQWLRLLREGTTAYAAQPYRHLADATAAAGHDDETRTVLIDQRRHQIAEGNLRLASRAWAKFTGLTLNYGYQPWRALVWAGAATLLSVLLTITLGNAGGLLHTPATGPAMAGTPCNTAEHIGYALDGFLPVVRTGARDTCRPTLNTYGAILQLTGWTLGLITWAFLTLFIAGFTNIIRKT